MKYAHRLKDLREDRDLTQSDIAKVLGTTYQYYSTYEAGKREMPFSRAIKLAEYYNVSLDYLAGLIDTPQKLN
ncbi:MAG: helix-turn-helix transcriptional regulator [Clostridia bacterium]|nr:helix-turn-helix transcriptional regulator [Clostridia bacterium]